MTVPTSHNLSVALPVYNGADYIAEAIDSVLAQTHRNFELIVSDNNSADGTSEIVAAYAARDSRVKHHRSDTLLPQADNINRAVALSSGVWVKLLCHDDVMQPDCLAKIHAVTERPDADRIGLIGNGEAWLFARGYELEKAGEISGDTEVIDGREAIHRFIGQSHKPLAFPGLTNATVRKSAFEALGGFDRANKNFDVFLWLTMWTQWSYAFVPGVLTKMRIHAAQVTKANRLTNRNVVEFRAFFPNFVKVHGAQLGLTWGSRIRFHLKPLSRAASEIALEFAKGETNGAFHALRQTPLHWWPLLPPFMLRSLKLERTKMQALKGKVELWEIYP